MRFLASYFVFISSDFGAGLMVGFAAALVPVGCMIGSPTTVVCGVIGAVAGLVNHLLPKPDAPTRRGS